MWCCCVVLCVSMRAACGHCLTQSQDTEGNCPCAQRCSQASAPPWSAAPSTWPPWAFLPQSRLLPWPWLSLISQGTWPHSFLSPLSIFWGAWDLAHIPSPAVPRAMACEVGVPCLLCTAGAPGLGSERGRGQAACTPGGPEVAGPAPQARPDPGWGRAWTAPGPFLPLP